MRHLLLITLLFCGYISSYSQGFNYKLTVTQNTYASLAESDSVLSDSSFWETNTKKIPLGFNFTFGDLSFDKINVRNTGVLSFDDNNNYSIVAFMKNFNLVFDTSNILTSKVQKALSTNPINGSLVFKIEFNNVSYFSESGKEIHVNFQVWLNQIDGSIEFHFGSNAFEGQQENIVIGLLDLNANDGLGTGLALSGDTMSPSIISVTSFNNLALLSNIPASGTVYVFTKI